MAASPSGPHIPAQETLPIQTFRFQVLQTREGTLGAKLPIDRLAAVTPQLIWDMLGAAVWVAMSVSLPGEPGERRVVEWVE